MKFFTKKTFAFVLFSKYVFSRFFPLRFHTISLFYTNTFTLHLPTLWYLVVKHAYWYEEKIKENTKIPAFSFAFAFSYGDF